VKIELRKAAFGEASIALETCVVTRECTHFQVVHKDVEPPVNAHKVRAIRLALHSPSGNRS
jgi:hypothetical protein